MSRAIVFPGQGSQAVGMGRALAESERVARDVFEEVDEALSQSLSKIMWEGPTDALILTENAQPALMAVSMAVVRVLEASGKKLTDLGAYVAGHSLGEYSALAASGALSLSDAARLLKIRGQAMQSAVPVGKGGMAALLGLDMETVVKVTKAASTDSELVVPANDNADGQIVVSGHMAAVDRAIELAKAQGAKRGLKLPVSAPFHSPLMQPAAEKMQEALADVSFLAPVLPVLTNVTTKPETDPDRLKALLVEQVTAPVRWRETIESLSSLGVTGQIEMGAGKVLSGLARRINRDLDIISLETPQDIEAFLK